MDPNVVPVLVLMGLLVGLVAALGVAWDVLRRRRRTATLMSRTDTEERARSRLHYWVHVGDSSNQ